MLPRRAWKRKRKPPTDTSGRDAFSRDSCTSSAMRSSAMRRTIPLATAIVNNRSKKIAATTFTESIVAHRERGYALREVSRLSSASATRSTAIS
jgi:hypothetical protein